MAGFSITTEILGLDEAHRIYRQVRNLGEDVTPLLQIAGSVLETSTLKHFDEERGPGGVPWPKSKRALGTAPNYRGVRAPGKTLQDSGDLRDSIRYEVRPGEVEIGSDGLKNPVKAIANQEGSNRQAVVVRHTRVINSAFGVPLDEPRTVEVRAHGRITNLPARPFIGPDEDDRRELITEWRRYLIGRFK